MAPADPPTDPAAAELGSAVALSAGRPASEEQDASLARLDDDGAPPPAPVAPLPMTIPGPDALPALELRVRRLEEALAQLQEQHGIETRFTAPLNGPRPAERPSAPPPTSTATLFDVGKRLLGASAEAVTPPPVAPSAVPPPPAPARPLWLFWDTLAEARAIVRMLVDPRYHLPWSARVLPLFLLAAFLIPKKYWVPGAQIPLLGDWLLSKFIDLLLTFVLFKWLGHEARRYRQTSPDLPPTLRL